MPYATRALNAANADFIGGFDINGFVQNTRQQQTGNFNLTGDGTLGGILTTNRVGVGAAPQAEINFDVTGNSAFRTANGLTQFGSPNGETGMSVINTLNASRADFRFNGSTLKLVAGAGTGPPSAFSGLIATSAGNVGIGTETPSSKLTVNGDFFSTGDVGINGTLYVGGNTIGNFSSSNKLSVFNGLSVNSGNLLVAGVTTLNNGLTLTGDASVSGKITTNSLRVNSGFSFATIAGTYTQDICRDTIAGTLGQCGTSLRRYKTAVENFSGGLNIVSRLRPVSFKWKESGQRDVGFIAEEVFEIEPLLTTTGDNGELLFRGAQRSGGGQRRQSRQSDERRRAAGRRADQC